MANDVCPECALEHFCGCGDREIAERLLSTRPSRRERIATAVLAGGFAIVQRVGPQNAALKAIEYADALIAELDKGESA